MEDSARLGINRKKEETKTLACVPPDSVVGKDTSIVANMFGSHDWVVTDSKEFGRYGVLICMHCSKCDADGMATLQGK